MNHDFKIDIYGHQNYLVRIDFSPMIQPYQSSDFYCERILVSTDDPTIYNQPLFLDGKAHLLLGHIPTGNNGENFFAQQQIAVIDWKDNFPINGDNYIEMNSYGVLSLTFILPRQKNHHQI